MLTQTLGNGLIIKYTMSFSENKENTCGNFFATDGTEEHRFLFCNNRHFIKQTFPILVSQVGEAPHGLVWERGGVNKPAKNAGYYL